MDFQTPDSDAIFQTPDSDASKLQSTWESGARGALRNFPLGQQAAAAIAPINPFSEKKTYGEEMPYLTEKAEQAKEQNKKSYYAGAAAGTVAPMLLPGVGEALEAAPVLGNAALGAANGISDSDVVRDPVAAAKNAAIGGGIGGATAYGLGKVFGGAKAAPAVENAAEDVAPEVAAKVAPEVAESAVPEVAAPRPSGPSKLNGIAVPDNKVAPDFVPSAERVYASNLAQGMGGTPRQLIKVLGKQDPVEALGKIGAWMETAGPEGQSLHGLLDRPGELLGKITDLHESSGKTIGGIIDKMGTGAGFDRAGLEVELLDYAQKTADPQTEARIMKLISTSENLGKKGVSDFDALQQIKGMAGKQIAKDPEMSEVYGHLADKMSELVDRYGQAIKQPGVAQDYAKAKVDFHNTSRLLPMLRYAEAKDLVGGPAGHHTLRGLLSSIFNMATMMTGLPPVEQLGKNVALKAAPVARGIVNAGVNARSAALGALPTNGLSQAARMELGNFLESQQKKGNP